MSARPSRWRVHLTLGRVSNLLTVWSNVIAAVVLAGGAFDGQRIALLGAAMSAFYVAGMYLNDAFDAAIDARERPERPIPAGWISARAVLAIGAALLVAGMATLLLAWLWGGSVWTIPAGVALVAAIVGYDAWHKGNPLSAAIMGLCRLLVYVVAALGSGGTLGLPLWIGAAALWCWVVGLTYAARYEASGRFRWTPSGAWPLALLSAPLALLVLLPSRPAWLAAALLAGWAVHALRLLRARAIPRAVGALIAGIALVDAVACAAGGSTTAALVAVAAGLLTLGLHRVIAGT